VEVSLIIAERSSSPSSCDDDIITTFLRSVDAGEILLASRGRNLRIFRGPCKALIIPVITQSRVIPAQAINVDIEITDQTADIDPNGRPAPVKVTVRASAIVSVGEDEAMVNTAATNSSPSRAASNSPRSPTCSRPPGAAPSTAQARSAIQRPLGHGPGIGRGARRRRIDGARAARASEDDELAVIIKDACSRELLDLGSRSTV